MARASTISWTEATWNPIAGCSVISPGCTNCYAMKMAARLERMLPPDRRGEVVLPNHYAALTKPSKGGPVWTGRINVAPDRIVTQPLRVRKPTIWFVNSMSDLFHESVPDAWIDRVFAVMALAPQHTFQVLTKRSARMRVYCNDPATPGRVARVLIDRCLIAREWPMVLDIWPVRSIGDIDLPDDVTIQWPLPNVWLGVSTEDQRRADERIPDLLATPAAVRFLSAEPLLGPLNLHEYLLGFAAGHPASCACGHGHGFDRCPNYGRVALSCHRCDCRTFRKARGSDGLHWIIAGGESGPGARPMHPDWARSLRDQCAAAAVPFHFKQWGAWAGLDGDAQPPGAFGEFIGDHWLADQISEQWGTQPMARIGTKASGRLLDGVEHNGMPGGATHGT